jgi:uncharacterized membrane protein YdcZ (DUF606 family)
MPTFVFLKCIHLKLNEMKKPLGIVLIVIGIIMMIYTGFTYVTKEKVVDIGPIEINKEKQNRVNWPPVAGLVLIVGGIAIIALDRKKSIL